MTTRRPRAARPLSHYIRAEAHGEFGDGKTRFAASFPGPKFWHDPTHGCDHFLTLHLEQCPMPSNDALDCMGPPCLGDYVENTLNPEDYYASLEWALKAAYAGKIRTIALDDQSVMKDRMVCSVVADPDAKVPIDDWGSIKRPLNRILTKISAAPVHLIITSRASMVGVTADNQGKITNVHKAATPKVWDDWLYPVDFAFYLYSTGTELAADKLKYFAQIQKSRIQDIPSLKQGRVLENPSFQGLFADLLKREEGLPLPEYDDPDTITRNGAVASMLMKEERYENALAALKNAATLETLTGAWTTVTTGITAGAFTDAQQVSLREAATASKARLKAVTK